MQVDSRCISYDDGHGAGWSLLRPKVETLRITEPQGSSCNGSNTHVFSGLYNVGKAAEYPPALVVLSHTPSGASQSVAWVGKGIVYDTGGLSIKGKVNAGIFHRVKSSQFLTLYYNRGSLRLLKHPEDNILHAECSFYF